MASQPDYEASVNQIVERFRTAAQQAFAALARGLQPVLTAFSEFGRRFKANRRIRRAVHLGRWIQVFWYVGEHQRRLASRNPRNAAKPPSMACDACSCSEGCDCVGDAYNVDTEPMIDCLAAK